MYQAHFQLNQEPFSIAPDPAFLYLSAAHREALAHLMYGFSHGGFVLITGEVGTGKTTLLRNLLKATPPDLDVAFVLNPRLTVRELLETLCEELGVRYDASSTQTVKQFIDALNRHLLKTHQSGRSTVVIIDEAQNLSPAVLEQVRLLTNLETDEKKLLRIILVGQPELADLLARQELRQLAQRITARYHLGALRREDTFAYVAHRLSRAGGHPQIFKPAALRRLYRLSGGIPRIINVIADRALLGAYTENQHHVGARHISRAAREVLGRGTSTRWWMATGIVSLAVAGIAWAYLQPAVQSNPSPAAGTELAAAPPADEAQTAAPEVNPVPAQRPPQPPASDAVTLPPDGTQDQPAAPAAALQTAIPSDADSMLTLEQPPPEQTAQPAAEAQPRENIARPPGTIPTTQRQAYAAVFSRWGADYDLATSEIPCDFAPSAGLQCLSQYGSWSDVERGNLPVVLELWDEAPAPYHAGLTAIRNGRLTLSLGGENVLVDQRALRDAWYGAYVVLWQTPPGYRGSIRKGDEHETVGWLRQQLNAVSPMSLVSRRPNLFDDALHDAVLEFQRSEGLIIDGVVGPATWIRLASRLDLPAPELGS